MRFGLPGKNTIASFDGISSLLPDGQSVDGITFDQWGNPTSYRVLKYHPGDSRFSTGDEAVEVPAEWMIHIFRQDRPGLHRGVPELTSALPLFAHLRRYNLAILSAAEAAADFAAILYTDAPPSGEAEEGRISGFWGDLRGACGRLRLMLALACRAKQGHFSRFRYWLDFCLSTVYLISMGP